MLCGICGCTLAAAGCFGYIGWMVAVLVYSIQALVDHGSSNCTGASFKWLWWICISSACFAFSMLQQTQTLSAFKGVKDFATYIGLLWLFSLGFAIGTQYQYLDGCVGKAHHAMFVYMWGNYAVAMCITLCSACFAADEFFEKKAESDPGPAEPSLETGLGPEFESGGAA